MNVVPYRLIPDQGSAGYKLYQEELKAAAVAKAAKTAKAAAPKTATPKPTTTTATSTAKPAAPEKTATEEAKTPEAKAMEFFLNAAKVKYKEAGDRTPVQGVSTIGGSISYSAEEVRKAWGNPFVATVKNDFMFIMDSLDSYNRHIADVEKQQAKIAEGDMSYLENLTMSQSMLADAKASVAHKLEGIKQWAEENNTLSETQEFFGEYTEFTRGEKLSLQKLFSDFSIA